jgi:chromatin remodeling complex protein RSC6
MSTKTAKTAAKRATKTESKPESTPVVQESKKTASKKSKKEEVKQPEPEPVEEQAAEPKQRRVVTRESVETEFESLIDVLRNEIESIRGNTDKKKSTGVKFLRQVGKRLKVLKSDTLRIAKQKNRTNRNTNNQSGFMKPVHISKDMAKFTGWNAEELRSRVEVTKYLCNYVKEHNLQDPKDRRQIVPDDKLARLLNYDVKKDGKPLTYPYLQKKIQNHFTN